MNSEGEQRYRRLFESASDAIVIVDSASRILECNSAAESLLGLKDDQLRGRSIDEFLSHLPSADDGQASTEPEPAVARRDGTRTRIECRSVTLDCGRAYFLRDLTAMLAREAALRRSDEQHRRMTELSPDAILVHSNGYIVYCNAAFLRMVGAADESQVIGKPSLHFLHPDFHALVQERVKTVESHRDVATIPEKFVRIDGTVVDVEVAGLALEYEGRPSVQMIARDIGKRVQQDKALRRSEERFRGLVDGASEAIYRVRPDGEILDVNPATTSITGWPADLLVGQRFASLLHPDDLDAAMSTFRSAIDGRPAKGTFRVLTRAGGYVYLETTNTQELNDGVVVGIFGMARDITEERVAALEIESREQLLATVLDRLPVGVLVSDSEGNIVRSNPAADEIWAMHRTVVAIAAPLIYEACWTDSGEPLGPDDWASTRALRHGETALNELVDIVAFDGTRKTILNSAVPLRDEHGGIRGAVVLNQDVTEQRANVRDREAMAGWLRQTISSTTEGVCTIDLVGRTLLVNPAAAAMLAMTEAEMIGSDLDQLLHGVASSLDTNEFLKVMRERQSRPLYGDSFRNRQGRTFDVEVSCAPIVVADQVIGAVVAFHDVSERNALERELERASRLSSVGQLAATVAHEFNNVLMGMQPFIEVISRRSESDESLRVIASHIQAALQRGKQITLEILKFAQAPEPEALPTIIASLLTSSFPELQAIAGRNISINILNRSPDIAARIDRTQVQQVLSNLVANARDAMNGTGTITITVEEATSEELARLSPPIENEGVRLSITDAGTGIDPQTIDMIFEPMFTTKRAGGTGLGLAVVHQVMRKHHGGVSVESTPGKGTTFHLFLPRCEPPEPDADTVMMERPRKARTIVIVEDDENVSAGLKAIMEMEGLSVHLVALGGQAEEAVERNQPDAVILDRGLPDMDGMEVFRRLASRWPDLPIIFSTGHGARDDLDPMLNRPHIGYLLKPYEVDKLLALVDEVVGKAT